MLFRERIVVYLENETKHRKCGQNAESLRKSSTPDVAINDIQIP
jgi:hypothetical protein